jgi:hypothetical protein
LTKIKAITPCGVAFRREVRAGLALHRWLTAISPLGYDFFGRATRIVPSKGDTQQNLSDRRCFFRSNGVVERFVEPTKIFLGLNLYSKTRFTADYFFAHC